jgi:hypothetical protein
VKLSLESNPMFNLKFRIHFLKNFVAFNFRSIFLDNLDYPGLTCFILHVLFSEGNFLQLNQLNFLLLLVFFSSLSDEKYKVLVQKYKTRK